MHGLCLTVFSSAFWQNHVNWPHVELDLLSLVLRQLSRNIYINSVVGFNGYSFSAVRLQSLLHKMSTLVERLTHSLGPASPSFEILCKCFLFCIRWGWVLFHLSLQPWWYFAFVFTKSDFNSHCHYLGVWDPWLIGNAFILWKRGKLVARCLNGRCSGVAYHKKHTTGNTSTKLRMNILWSVFNPNKGVAIHPSMATIFGFKNGVYTGNAYQMYILFCLNIDSILYKMLLDRKNECFFVWF